MKRPFLTLLFLCGLTTPVLADQQAVQALQAAERSQWDIALASASTSRDALARDLVQWYYLLDSGTDAGFERMSAFLQTHRDWPSAERLQKAAENKMPETVEAAKVMAFFGQSKPQTANGMVRLLSAYLAQNQTQQALKTLQDWWPKATLDESEQTDILSRFGKYLDTADHKRRLEYVLDKQQYSQARALGTAMGKGWASLVEIRIALESGSGKTVQFSSLPQALLNDPGLMLSRVRSLVEAENNDDAMALLLDASAEAQASNTEDWAKARNILIRRFIEAKRYREAYALSQNSRLPKGGAEFANAEFMAGWLALRFLNEPETAFAHFETLFNNVKTPVSRSRGAYWAGRAAEGSKVQDVAFKWYQLAARYQTTWYGQKAAEHINLPTSLLDGLTPPITQQNKTAFESKPLVQAVRLFNEAGLTRQRGRFFNALLETLQSPQDYFLTAQLAESIGQNDGAVKVAKKAERDSVFLTQYAYPVLRAAKSQGVLDPSIVHGIIRQESQFDPFAESPAGALGLMQLMPATAELTARKAGLPSNLSQLTSDPAYNIALGSRYLSSLIDRFDGSLPLAVAGYNAGPGRVDQWLEKFGDPRTGAIDMVDWIELIPIYETRNYVQRVLEAKTVYNARLNLREATLAENGR